MAGVVERLKGVRSRLEIAFTFDMADLAHLMNLNGFLSDEDHSTVTAIKTLLSERDKTQIMVNSLIKKVEISVSNYEKFLVLVKGNRKYSDIVEVLQDDGGQSQVRHSVSASMGLSPQHVIHPSKASKAVAFGQEPGPAAVPHFSTPSNGMEHDGSLLSRALHPSSSEARCQRKLDTVDDTVLGENHLLAVLDEVEDIAAKWKVLGTKLGIGGGTKDAIGEDNDDSLQCLDALLTAWLKLNYDYDTHGKPSWKRLAQAVMKLDGSMFDKIVKKHRAGGIGPNIGTMKTRVTEQQCPVLGHCIVMADVQMIKWKTLSGHCQYLRIMEEVATKWKRFGDLLKISSSVLESYETQSLKKNEECIRHVFIKWMEIDSEEYPTTWVGLIKLLDNVGFSSIADTLEKLAVDYPEALSRGSSN